MGWIGSAVQFAQDAIRRLLWPEPVLMKAGALVLPDAESGVEGGDHAILHQFPIDDALSDTTEPHQVLLTGDYAKVRYPFKISYLEELPDRILDKLRPIVESETVTEDTLWSWKLWEFVLKSFRFSTLMRRAGHALIRGVGMDASKRIYTLIWDLMGKLSF